MNDLKDVNECVSQTKTILSIQGEFSECLSSYNKTTTQ